MGFDGVSAPAQYEQDTPVQEASHVQALTSQSAAAQQSAALASDKAGKDKSMQQQIDRGNFPDLYITDAKSPIEDQSERSTPGAAKLEGDASDAKEQEKKRIQYLQISLIHVLPELALKPGTATVDENRKKHVIQELSAIAGEQKAGVYGPATRAAFAEYIAFLKVQAPDTVKQLENAGLSIPANCPLTRKANDKGPAIWKERFDTNSAPSDDDLDRLDRILQWRLDACKQLKSVSDKESDAHLREAIENNHLPHGWLEHLNGDDQAWRSSARQMINLTLVTKNYIEAIDELNKATIDPSDQIPLPPGAQVFRDKNGKITGVKLDLPQDLRQEDPSNRQKIEKLTQWLDKVGPSVERTISELEQELSVSQKLKGADGRQVSASLQAQPDSIISWGETELRGMKARIGSDGHLIGLVDPKKYTARDGETLQDCNLLNSTFNVQYKNGKVIVTQDVRAQLVPVYGYQNLIKSDVGKQLKLSQREYNPDDLVAVLNDGQVRLVKASALDSFANRKELQQNAGKAIIGLMDAAMVVTGTLEIGAALKLARVGFVVADQTIKCAGEEALKLTGRQAAMQIGRSGLRVLAGGAGIFNNAGGHDNRLLSDVNDARNLYFMADIMHDFGSLGWKALRGSGPREITSAEKIHNVLSGNVPSGIAALGELSAARIPYKAGQLAFKAGEYGMIPGLVSGIYAEASGILKTSQPDALDSALTAIGDGRGPLPAREQFDLNNPKSLDAARKKLSTYEELLCEGKSDAARKNIQQIFALTKQAIDPKATQQDREKARQQLLTKVTFTPDQLSELESCSGANRVNGLAEKLQSPEGFKGLAEQQQNLVQRFRSQRDKDEELAAVIGLTYLSRDKNNNVKPDLGQLTSVVPEWTWNDDIDAGMRIHRVVRKVSAHPFQQKITIESVTAPIAQSLDPHERPGRSLVAAEFLTRLGKVDPREYASVIEDVLKNPASSKRDKLAALTGQSGVGSFELIRALRACEAKPRNANERDDQLGASYGASSRDLTDTLNKVAGTDSDKDIRAVASAIVMCAEMKDETSSAQAFRRLQKCIEQAKDKADGSICASITRDFHNSMQAVDPGAQTENSQRRKLENALALARVIDRNDRAQQLNLARTLGSLFSSDNPELNADILDNLSEENLELLKRSDPVCFHTICAKAVDSLSFGDNQDNARVNDGKLVQSIHAMEKLARHSDATFKKAYGKQLYAIIDPEDNRGQYCPSAQAAAITALAGLSDGSHLDYIRAMTGCADARVRLAAVQALQKLHDPDWPALKQVLLKDEHDLAVLKQVNTQDR